MITLQAIADGWNFFFHDPTPTTTVSVFRICWGCVLTVNAILHCKQASLYFGPIGLLPTQIHRQVYGRSRFTLFHFFPDNMRSVYLILALNLVASVALGLGFQTKISTAIVFITLLSLHHRNPAIIHSGDTLLRLMTFYMIFSRAGADFSLDSIMYSEVTLSLRRSSPWAERLMQIQVCIVYARAASWKWRGKMWREGTAVYYPLQLKNFIRFKVPQFFLNIHTIKILTWSVLVIESTFPILVWIQELRYVVLVAVWCLHIGLEFFLNLQLFGWTMIVCLFLFVDSNDILNLLTSIGLK